jgi:hypothetical protein
MWIILGTYTLAVFLPKAKAASALIGTGRATAPGATAAGVAAIPYTTVILTSPGLKSIWCAGLSVIEDLEYVRVYEDAGYRCIEDKIAIRYPLVGRSSTKTFYIIIFDFVELPNGELYAARVCYPKEIPKRIVLQAAHTWNERWARKISEIQMIAQTLAPQTQEQPSEAQTEVSVSELEESLRRIREYLSQLR